MSGYRHLTVEQRGSATIATIQESAVDTSIAAEMLASELLHVVNESGPALLIVNCAHVRMFSSATIGVLLKVRQRLLELGGQLRLCHVGVPIAEVCRVLNLDRALLLVFDTVEQAMAAQIIASPEEREVMED